jgi:hypothetical protein
MTRRGVGTQPIASDENVTEIFQEQVRATPVLCSQEDLLCVPRLKMAQGDLSPSDPKVCWYGACCSTAILTIEDEHGSKTWEQSVMQCDTMR